MPRTDATFAIGVIREREKGFLTEEQYLRLHEAPTVAEAIHVLAETPYGTWFETTASLAPVMAALEKSLLEELRWISDVSDRAELTAFITARYDALNCAYAIIAANHSREELPPLSALGSLAPELLFSAVWNDIGWENIPPAWQAILKMKGATTGAVLAAATAAWLAVIAKNAVTPLSRRVVALAKVRLQQDEAVRQAIEADTPGNELNLSSAIAYERDGDNAVITELYQYRHEPTGSDPILAYWLAKEQELRTVRLLLVAKAGGVPAPELRELRRVLYTTRP